MAYPGYTAAAMVKVAMFILCAASVEFAVASAASPDSRPAPRWQTGPAAAATAANPVASANASPAPAPSADVAPAPPPQGEPVPAPPKSWTLRTKFDDAGAPSNGREQAGLALVVNDVLARGDEFEVGTTRDARLSDKRRGKRAWEVRYGFPAGAWTLELSGETNDFFLRHPGGTVPAEARGSVKELTAAASRDLFRDERRSLGIRLRVARRFGRWFRDAREVDTSYVNHAFIEVGLRATQRFGDASIDALLARRLGVPVLGARRDAAGARTHRYRMTLMEIDLRVPLSAAGIPLVYAGKFRGRFTEQPLLAMEELMLGGRKTVRGYGNDPILTGGKGFYLRNDLIYRLPASNVVARAVPKFSVYAGLDVGRIVRGRRGVARLPANLAGAVLGLRGGASNLRGLAFDVFVARPLLKPRVCRIAPVALGVTLTWRH